MTFMSKPKGAHPELPRNALGLPRRDYAGAHSPLCAGCGPDSVPAAIVEACWADAIEPKNLIKLSGSGCSSKTTAYFVSGAHGFNSVHGRMPSIAPGANAANRRLQYIGVSGDGDTLSIGLGQFCHAIRRNLNMVYVIENNGVYGLTKGQFSSSADVGSTTKRGEANHLQPIDPMFLGLSVGATFLARGFSGDKRQLVPIFRAAMAHRGLAIIDVISPCVTFNDHEGSTKSYLFTRQHDVQMTVTDFVPPAEEITGIIPDQGVVSIPMHDGATLRFRSVPDGYDPTDRLAVIEHLMSAKGRGEIVTGLLYVDEQSSDLHELGNTTEKPLTQVPYEKLCPGSAALAGVGFR